VLAQRLARRLCERCKEEYTPEPEMLRSARFPWTDGEPLPTLFRAVGCSACAKTGYKGRVALNEIMLVSEEIERLTVERATAVDIGKVAESQGMRPLRLDGMDKARVGLTTVEEVLRVVV
jgi:type IV pilus assembly protein PilB